jgi:hypothetical protein
VIRGALADDSWTPGTVVFFLVFFVAAGLAEPAGAAPVGVDTTDWTASALFPEPPPPSTAATAMSAATPSPERISGMCDSRQSQPTGSGAVAVPGPAGAPGPTTRSARRPPGSSPKRSGGRLDRCPTRVCAGADAADGAGTTTGAIAGKAWGDGVDDGAGEGSAYDEGEAVAKPAGAALREPDDDAIAASRRVRGPGSGGSTRTEPSPSLTCSVHWVPSQ